MHELNESIIPFIKLGCLCRFCKQRLTDGKRTVGGIFENTFVLSKDTNFAWKGIVCCPSLCINSN